MTVITLTAPVDPLPAATSLPPTGQSLKPDRGSLNPHHGGSKADGSELLSTAALQIIQTAVREDASVDDLVQLAKTDPAFGIRLLAVVNSAALKRREPVTDIAQASSLLGLRGLRNVALSLVVSDLAPADPEADILLANALRRGVAGRLLAPHLGKVDAECCFTAGLMLEMGLLLRARVDLPGAVGTARLPAQHRVIRERAAGFLGHPWAGAEVARRYQLPEEIAAAIEHHHDPQCPNEPVARVAWAAEQIASIFESADVVTNREAVAGSLRQLGLGSEILEHIIEALPAAVNATAAAFNRKLNEQLDLAKLKRDAAQCLIELNQQYQELVVSLEQLVTERTELAERLELANQALERIAATDPLTGLPNRRMLESAMARDVAHAAREEQPLSLLVLDVDLFKQFNDTFGHKVGDEVLQAVARIIEACIRQSDLAARYGGEEFVVILPNTNEGGARLAGERIRRRLESTPMVAGNSHKLVTASFGVATALPPFVENVAARLFARADAALYKAKQTGRNRVVVAPPDAAGSIPADSILHRT